MFKEKNSKRKNYKHISQEVRQHIIDSILNQDQNIKKVSNLLGVKVSTCKAIIKFYEQQGRIGKKKNRNKVHQVILTFSFFTVNVNQIQQLGGIQIQQSKLSLQRKYDFDQHLKAKSKLKSQKLLDSILQEKRKLQEAAYKTNRPFVEYIFNPTNWMAVQFKLLCQMQIDKPQEDIRESFSFNNQCQLQSKQIKQQ